MCVSSRFSGLRFSYKTKSLFVILLLLGTILSPFTPPPVLPAFATIAGDNTTTDCVDAQTSTHSHTVSGSDTLLIVTVGTAAGQTASNVNFGGTTLTEVDNRLHANAN